MLPLRLINLSATSSFSLTSFAEVLLFFSEQPKRHLFSLIFLVSAQLESEELDQRIQAEESVALSLKKELELGLFFLSFFLSPFL